MIGGMRSLTSMLIHSASTSIQYIMEIHLFLIHTAPEKHSIKGRPQITSGNMSRHTNNTHFYIITHSLCQLRGEDSVKLNSRMIYDAALYCPSSTLCTWAPVMCHTVVLRLLFGIKTQLLQSAGRYHYRQTGRHRS